jgi:hypothetical protein
MHHHHHHKKHSKDVSYHLEGDRLCVRFLDNFSPDVAGTVTFSHFHHGHGGQNLNKSNKGVHITFTPDGGDENILVSCINERSEIQNREEALKNLLDKIEEKFKRQPPRMGTKVPFYSKIERIESKKKRGQIKSNRQGEDYLI